MSKITKQQIAKVIKFHSLQSTFQGVNLWTIQSGENFYNVEIFFQGYDSKFEHGLRLKGVCDCSAGRFGNNCLHADKAIAEYEKDFSKLFPLFGLEVPSPIRYDQLNQRIISTVRRLKKTGFQKLHSFVAPSFHFLRATLGKVMQKGAYLSIFNLKL